jgi:hypothetical protein
LRRNRFVEPLELDQSHGAVVVELRVLRQLRQGRINMTERLEVIGIRKCNRTEAAMTFEVVRPPGDDLAVERFCLCQASVLMQRDRRIERRRGTCHRHGLSILAWWLHLERANPRQPSAQVE